MWFCLDIFKTGTFYTISLCSLLGYGIYPINTSTCTIVFYILCFSTTASCRNDIKSFVSGMIGLGVHFSTYISEVYRSGIEDIDEGQWEAATALNLPTYKKWMKIILPQALPPTIPMLGNYLIILFKEVPLASTIGVIGILQLANDYGAKTW